MTLAKFLRAMLSDALLAMVVALALFFSWKSAKADENLAAYWTQQYEARIQTRAKPQRLVAHEHGVTRSPLAAMVTESALRHGVPPAIAHAIVQIESRYSCRARSPSNARGIMQVLPRTAASVGVTGNLYDCATGLEAGMRYLHLVISTHGTSCGALGTYERGVFARARCTAYGRRAVQLASR